MPSDTSDEHVDLRRRGRRRLIGAVTMALLAVVVVPMVLDRDSRPARSDLPTAIPPRESAPPLTAVPATAAPVPAVSEAPKPMEASPAPVAASSAERPAIAEPPGAKPETATVEPRKTVEPKASEFKASPRPPAAAAPKTEAPPRGADVKLVGFAVQVGAFKDDAKLAQARDRIAAGRLPHYTERLQTSTGELTRLRAGPFPTREAADKAAAKLKSAGLDVRVVPLP